MGLSTLDFCWQDLDYSYYFPFYTCVWNLFETSFKKNVWDGLKEGVFEPNNDKKQCKMIKKHNMNKRDNKYTSLWSLLGTYSSINVYFHEWI